MPQKNKIVVGGYILERGKKVHNLRCSNGKLISIIPLNVLIFFTKITTKKQSIILKAPFCYFKAQFWHATFS